MNIAENLVFIAISLKRKKTHGNAIFCKKRLSSVIKDNTLVHTNLLGFEEATCPKQKRSQSEN